MTLAPTNSAIAENEDSTGVHCHLDKMWWQHSRRAYHGQETLINGGRCCSCTGALPHLTSLFLGGRSWAIC